MNAKRRMEEMAAWLSNEALDAALDADPQAPMGEVLVELGCLFETAAARFVRLAERAEQAPPAPVKTMRKPAVKGQPVKIPDAPQATDRPVKEYSIPDDAPSGGGRAKAPWKKLTAEEIATIRRMAADGVRAPDVARAIGRSKTAVRPFVQAVQGRRSMAVGGRIRSLTNAEITRVEDAVLGNESIPKVAVELGRPEGTVYKAAQYIRERNLVRQKREEAGATPVH